MLSVTQPIPPTPPKKLETHICTPTHSNTQRCRPHNENTTICSRSLFFFLFFLADTPTHACTHLHAQRKPFSRFPPITAALACRRGRQEATFRKQKGLLLCFDGELTPGVACSFSAKARMKEEQKVSHTLQYTLAKIPLLCFFSFPYHGELLRGGGYVVNSAEECGVT